ncbi:MAG TPA: exodeoxyribonuclease VII large subunit, partial [Exilispira sp.]|nr:exodeoxyribonuclease VII large subunit [Exilispira sp.]
LTFFQKRAINIIQSKIDNKKITLDNFLNRLQRQSISLFKDRKSRLESVTRLLNTLSVENILKKGYSITLSEDGKIISDINKIFLHQNVRTIISNGYFESTIDKISKDDYFDTDKK